MIWYRLGSQEARGDMFLQHGSLIILGLYCMFAYLFILKYPQSVLLLVVNK